MKKQFIISLAIAVASLTSCDDNETPQPSFPQESKPEIVVRSFYPSFGAPGTTVTIFGENFGGTIEEHDVTFDSTYAEITDVGFGVLKVKVPAHLANGDYAINVRWRGQFTSAPARFNVTEAER
jgi:IPT/TIG domain